MANNQSTFTLKLETKGLPEAQKGSQQVRDNLEAAQAAATGTSAAMKSAATASAPGTPSTRKMASSAAAQPTGRAGASAGVFTGSEVEEYNRAAGAAGRAGGSARDFADQARGLGGLVRLYAMLAANLYAATAAFTALSNAADTANLIKGIEQLSASSGQNLASLAKDFTKATDGAVSLKESISVIAKASSAGISSENIKRLGEVAKNASQALGVDTVTAVDRLTRGITKLEPELLDELGLFTKIGPATEEYARAIGKSALALTDFERRQAFANAVLAEGEKKFGDIALQANPYTKLTAQLKDLTLAALTFVNKGIIPIAEFLTANPMALAGVLALIGKSLLGVTIPAVSSWKNNMKAAAEQADQLAKAAVDARREQRAWKESLIGVQVAEKSRLATQEASLRLTELQNKANAAGSKISQGTKSLVSGIDPSMKLDTDAQRIAAQRVVDDLEKRRQVAEKALSELKPSSTVAIAAKKEEIDLINKSTEALKTRLKTEVEFNRVINQPRPGWWTAAAADDRRARDQILDAQKKSITSNALEQQSLNGTIAGFRALYDGITKARAGQDLAGAAYVDGTRKLGLLSTVATTAAGSMQLLGAGVSAVASAISKALVLIGIFTAAFQAFDFYLTKSKKEEEAFKDATDRLNSSVKLAGATLEEVGKKKFLDAKSVQSTANAFNELTVGLQKQIKTFGDLRAAQGGWDRWWDNAWNRIGRGSTKEISTSITNAILASLDLADDEIKPKLQEKYKEILGFEVTGGRDNLLSGISKLVNEDQNKLLEIVPKIESIGRAIGNTASNTTLLDAGLTEISKEINDINNSLKLTDLQGKLGTSLLAESERLAKAFDSSKTGLIALQKIVSDFNLISLFPPEEAENLARSKAKIEELSKAYQKAETAKRELEAQLQRGGTDEARAGIQAALNQATKEFNKIKGEVDVAVGKFRGVVTSGIIEQAFKKVEVSLKNAMVEASIISARSYLSVLSSIGGSTAKQEGELKIRELESQKALVTANYEHANEIQKLRLVAEQQLQVDRIMLAIKTKEDAAGVAAGQKAAKQRAQEFVDLATKNPAAAQMQFRVIGEKGMQPAGAAPMAGPSGLFYDKKKFDAFLAESKLTANSAIQTVDQITAEADLAINQARSALVQATKASTDFFTDNKINNKAVAAAAKETGTFASDIAKGLLINSKSLQASLVKLDEQIAATKLDTFAKQTREDAEKLIQPEVQKAQVLETRISGISNQQEILGYYNEQLALKKQQAEQELIIVQREQDRLRIGAAITIAEELVNRYRAQGKQQTEEGVEAQRRLNDLRQDDINNAASWAQKRTSLDAGYDRARFAEVERKAEAERVYQEQIVKSTEDRQRISLDAEKQLVDSLTSRGLISQEYSAQRLADIAKENQAITYQAQLREAMQQKEDADRAAYSKRAAAFDAGVDDAAAERILQEELTKSRKLFIEKRNSIELSNISTTRGIELTKQQSIETAKQNEQLKKQAEILGLFQGIADVLSQAFGKAGAAAGSFISAIGNAITSQETYNTEKSKQLKIISDIDAKERETITSDDLKQKEEASKKLGELEKKNARQELTDNARLVGSAKNLFKEKTVAYKALHNIEKALHIARIAMDLKELATSLFVEKGKVAGSIAGEGAQTAATSAGFFARAGLYVTEIFSKISAQLGVFGPPVAAAIVAAIGLSAFGKKSVQPGGFTAEEQNKVQGTGQTYRDGKLVEREGGVLGDPTARASSVSKSLEFVGKNTFQFLESGNKMIDALKSIEKNTRGLTAAMLRSLNPTARGSLPGSIMQGEKRGNYFGGTGMGAVVGGVGGFLAGTSAVAMGAIGGAVNTLTMGLIGGIAGAALPVIGLLLAKPIGKLMGSIFGGKTTQTIEAFGVTVNGVLDDVVKGTKGVIEEWANVKTVRKGGWFRSDKTTFETVKQEATDPVKDLVGSLFMGVRDTLSEASKALGADISTQLSNYLITDFKVNIKDLKPEEAAEAIQGEISILFNKMAMDLLPQFEKFALPFEEAGETIVRLARQVQVFDLGMLSINKSVEGMSNMMKVEISNSLIEAAGGMEQFVERTNFFAENFLTESERLIPIRAALEKEFKSLGEQLGGVDLSVIDTRDEFKNLVLGLDLTNEAQLAAYNTLQKLAPAFAEVNKEAQSASLSVAEFSKTVMGNEVDIIRMQANLLEKSGDFQAAYTKLQESVLLTRQAELAELEKLPEAQKTVLKYQLEYKYSLEDLASQTENNIKINNRLITAQQNLISYLDEAFGLLNQALRLRGEGIDAQYIERTIKLQDLSARYSGKENEERLRVLTGLQRYIWAMEDEQVAKDNYVKALQAQAAAIQREVDGLQKTLAGYDKLLDQNARITELKSGDAAIGKQLSREKELRELRNQFSADMVAVIAANQEYIWALEDEGEIKNKLIEAHNREKDAIEGTISSIKDAIKSIKDYRNSLAFSSELSVLTPEQQYKEARKIFEETLTAARTVGVDEAGTKAQQEALSKIPEVSNKFLELSRTLFASSGGYMTDYQVVQNALTMTEAALGEQLTEAEQQLAELKVISDSLNLIEENTKTAAQLFLEYQSAQRRTESAASAADSRSFEELQGLRDNVQNQIDTKLAEIKTINDTIAGLGERQLTALEAANRVAETSATYQNATANTSRILSEISGDVNNGTIRQAIEARQAASNTITELKLANAALEGVLANTFATYQSQITHFRNLVTTPQTVNLTAPVAQVLATIAQNTAQTATQVSEVKEAVVAGTGAVVSNNTAVSVNTADTIVEAVTSDASRWRESQNPDIRTARETVLIFD